MRFSLVDRVLAIESGVRIETMKSLALSEEYLADHFPRFPVMPGVLMVEAMTETCAWLLRVTDGFAQSIITLKEAKNVKFGAFVTPGKTLLISAELVKHDADQSQFKVQSTVEGKSATSGRLILQHGNLADHRPQLAATDLMLRRYFRQQWTLLYPGPPPQPTSPPARGTVAAPEPVESA